MTVSIRDYLKKIDEAQAAMEEVKRGLLEYQKQWDESIARGENDIAEGRSTTCKTPEDLDLFFASIQ